MDGNNNDKRVVSNEDTCSSICQSYGHFNTPQSSRRKRYLGQYACVSKKRRITFNDSNENYDHDKQLRRSPRLNKRYLGEDKENKHEDLVVSNDQRPCTSTMGLQQNQQLNTSVNVKRNDQLNSASEREEQLLCQEDQFEKDIVWMIEKNKENTDLEDKSLRRTPPVQSITSNKIDQLVCQNLHTSKKKRFTRKSQGHRRRAKHGSINKCNISKRDARSRFNSPSTGSNTSSTIDNHQLSYSVCESQDDIHVDEHINIMNPPIASTPQRETICRKLDRNNKNDSSMRDNKGNAIARQNQIDLIPDEKLMLSSWCLPSAVLERYQAVGITKMFEWQVNCLTTGNILNGGNLVYAAPTSAGKTLVAELLMLKRVLESKRKALLILPYVSVVREKSAYMQQLFETAGVRVSGFVGTQSPSGNFDNIDIAICTIEKANSLINRLMEENQLEQIGIVVVDEMHMIGDSRRGYLLELLLVKILYWTQQVRKTANKHNSVGIQVVGMSATLPNLHILAKWLNADLYTCTYRPVPLTQMIKIGKTIFNRNMQPLRSVEDNDNDEVTHICLETARDGYGLLVFCPTKNHCEKLAQNLATQFISHIQYTDKISISPNGEANSNAKVTLNRKQLMAILAQLKSTPVGLDSILEYTITRGIAFHHAGLTLEERDIIEAAFRKGTILIIIATSTLSSGVNLPARRVVIRTPIFYGRLIDIMTYQQMVGRAGRKGIDEIGESILLCKKGEADRVARLINATPDPIVSCFANYKCPGDNNGMMKRALLEVISSGFAKTFEDVVLYMSCTLLAASVSYDTSISLDNALVSTLQFLEDKEFIKSQVMNEGDDVDGKRNIQYYATKLGEATVASALSPDDALIVFADLQKARKNFVLENELHILYQVTPICIHDQLKNLDWYHYMILWERLSEDIKYVGEIIGVEEAYLAKAARGRLPRRTPIQRNALSIHLRFYIALALNELIHEVPFAAVSNRYGLSRGLLQSLQNSAATFAGMVTAFCKKLCWHNIYLLLDQFQSRLTFGIERELCDLVRISLLNGTRARTLYNAGLQTITAVAEASIATIEQILYKATPFKSKFSDGYHEIQFGIDSACPWIGCRRGLTYKQAANCIIQEAKKIALTTTAETRQRIHNNLTDIYGFKTDQLVLPVMKSTVPTSNDYLNEASYRINYTLSVSTKHTCNDNTEDMADLQEYKSIKKNLEYVGENVAHDELADIRSTIKVAQTSDLVSPKLNNVDKMSCNAVPLSQAFDYVSLSDSYLLRAAASVNENTNSSRHRSRKDNYSSMITEQSYEQMLSDDEFMAELNTQIVLAANNPTVQDINRWSKDDSSDFETLASLRQNNQQESNPTNNIGQDAPTFNIIDVTGNKNLFNVFIEEWKQQEVYSISIACEQKSQSKDGIGSNMIHNQSAHIHSCIPSPSVVQDDPYCVVGIAICWGELDSYYINMNDCKLDQGVDITKELDSTLSTPHSDPALLLRNRLNLISDVLSETTQIKIAYNIKEQYKVLMRHLQLNIKGNWRDPKVGIWLLDQDSQEKTFHAVVSKYLAEESILLDYITGSCLGGGGLGADFSSQVSGRRRACIEVVLVHKLSLTIDAILEERGLSVLYRNIEMPVIRTLCWLELDGIGFCMEQCQQQIESLQCMLGQIEQIAYTIAGRPFQLTSPADIAHILYTELRLGQRNDENEVKILNKKRSGKNSKKNGTGKEVLERLSVTHPLPVIVLEWRKLNSALTKTLYPLKRYSRYCHKSRMHRVFPVCQLHTATGRISLSDPNLQNIPREFMISIVNQESTIRNTTSFSSAYLQGQGKTVCMRNIIGCVNNGILLSADYSQLELRLIAHLSEDDQLGRVLNNGGDVFRGIAAEWLHLSIDEINEAQRQRAKQMCYGIIYGMTSRALGEQLKVSEEEAANFMHSFKSRYRNIGKFMEKTINFCHQEGYVCTIMGRKRLLPNIRSNNNGIRNHAERQAINTTVQGSAADLVKIAMINIYNRLDGDYQDKMQKCLMPDNSVSSGNNFKPKLVLQLHDELLFEVEESQIVEVARIVKQEMENAIKLRVKLEVKLKTGKYWGEMTNYVC